MLRTIALDTETTGFKFEEGHRVLEIGCIEMNNLIRTGNHFHVYINPERDVPQEAVNVHGLNSDFLKDKPKFSEIIDEFINFIGDSPLVIHNAQFDMAFLDGEFKKAGYTTISNQVIDTLTLSRKRLKIGRHTLDALCNYYKIDRSSRNLHGALIDADLLAQVYLELEGGAAYSMQLEDVNAKKSVSDVLIKNIPSLKIPQKTGHSKHFIPIVKAIETEMVHHKAFLEENGFSL